MNQYTPDQREAARPTEAEASLLAIHKRRAADLECAMAFMVGVPIALERYELDQADAG